MVPTPRPLTCHWYEGEIPPFKGVVVKDTRVPTQAGFCEAATVTLTGRFGLTIIAIPFDVAGLPEVQAKLEVSTHVTRSPFRGIYVKTGESVPAMIPLIFHWYAGDDPPLTGFAVKVTDVPEQILLAEEEMVNPTASGIWIVIWTTFDSAAPDQPGIQVTLAMRLYQVVCVMNPGL